MIGAGHALGGLVENAVDMDWKEAGGLVVALIGLLIAISFWLSALILDRQFDLNNAQAALILIIVVVMLLLAYGFWSGWRNALWLIGSFFISLMFLFALSRSTQLSLRTSAMRPSGFFLEDTHPALLRLVNDVQTLSAQRTGDPHAMALQIQTFRPAEDSSEVVLLDRIRCWDGIFVI